MYCEQAIRDKLSEVWDATGKRAKMDWLGMEDAIRAILRLFRESPAMDPINALKLIDETIGAYTRRGQEL